MNNTPLLPRPRCSRLTVWLSLAVCFWLAMIAATVLLARGHFGDGRSGSGSQALPELRSSLHLPYFSFARALRPGS